MTQTTVIFYLFITLFHPIFTMFFIFIQLLSLVPEITWLEKPNTARWFAIHSWCVTQLRFSMVWLLCLNCCSSSWIVFGQLSKCFLMKLLTWVRVRLRVLCWHLRAFLKPLVKLFWCCSKQWVNQVLKSVSWLTQVFQTFVFPRCCLGGGLMKLGYSQVSQCLARYWIWKPEQKKKTHCEHPAAAKLYESPNSGTFLSLGSSTQTWAVD